MNKYCHYFMVGITTDNAWVSHQTGRPTYQKSTVAVLDQPSVKKNLAIFSHVLPRKKLISSNLKQRNTKADDLRTR